MASKRDDDMSFERTSKRRRGFPPARPRSNAATGPSAAAVPSWLRSSADMTRAPAVPGGGFSRCCRPAGRYDGMLRDYHVRER
jgi:hypothetical protein